MEPASQLRRRQRKPPLADDDVPQRAKTAPALPTPCMFDSTSTSDDESVKSASQLPTSEAVQKLTFPWVPTVKNTFVEMVHPTEWGGTRTLKKSLSCGDLPRAFSTGQEVHVAPTPSRTATKEKATGSPQNQWMSEGQFPMAYLADPVRGDLDVQANPDLFVPPPPPILDHSLASIGSLGHPRSCEKACKYVWKRSGCRDGTACTRCHLCRPSKSQNTNVPSPETKAVVEVMPSIGSCVTPNSCENGCKYIWKKNGCRDGAACARCHVCPPGKAPEVRGYQSVSVGSVGHPHSCAPACKYNGKMSGCKDGPLCDRCHLCCWTRCNQVEAQQEVRQGVRQEGRQEARQDVRQYSPEKGQDVRQYSPEKEVRREVRQDVRPQVPREVRQEERCNGEVRQEMRQEVLMMGLRARQTRYLAQHDQPRRKPPWAKSQSMQCVN